MTDKLHSRPHHHRGRRPRRLGRRWARIAIAPVAVAAVAVAGLAYGLPGSGPHTTREPAAVPAPREATRPHPDAAPATAPDSTPPPSPGHALVPAPHPTARPIPQRSATSDPAGRVSPLGVASSASPVATAARATATAHRPTAVFRVASFNVLGASHTGPHSQRPRFATGVTRTPWAVHLLEASGVTVAGLQEFQPPQIRVFNHVADGWRAWPGLGSRAGVNSLVWQTSAWQRVETHTLDIPYFGGRNVPMPYVLLRQVGTGRQVWFANFHNPADAHGPAQRWRNKAVGREIALVNRLHADGTPVVVTGDFNDREAFFCPLASRAKVTSADGSHLTDTGCSLAPHPGVDWIVGTHDDVDFTDFHRIRGGLVSRTSDHPFVWARASLH